MTTVGLCMIVKNCAQTLRPCLASLNGAVDELVIGDNESADNTAAIAREFGAHVFTVPGTGDFAHARNTVLAKMTTDWVLVLDGDEVLPAHAAQWIRSAIQNRAIDTYRVDVRNYLSPLQPPVSDQIALTPGDQHPLAPDAVAYFPSAALRLFRRDPQIFYRGCVHEMIDHQVLGLGRTVADAGFVIHHLGWYLADAGRIAEKRALYCSLLAKKLETMPDDTNTLVRYAAFLYEDQQQPEAALTHLHRAITLDPNTPGAWLFTALILRKERRFEESLAAIENIPHDDSPVLRAHLQGDCLYSLGQLTAAHAAYSTALALCPHDRAVQCKLGETEIRLGNAGGLQRLEAASAAWPPSQDIDERFIHACFALNRLPQALSAADRFARKWPSETAWLRVARTQAQTGDWTRALATLEEALARFPAAEALHALKMQAALATQQWHQAADPARRLTELAPSPRAFLRLAAIYRHSGCDDQAAAALSAGTSLFPHAEEFAAWNATP